MGRKIINDSVGVSRFSINRELKVVVDGRNGKIKEIDGFVDLGF